MISLANGEYQALGVERCGTPSRLNALVRAFLSLKNSILEHDFVQIREIRKQVVFCYGCIPRVGTLTSEVKATTKSCMLVVVYQLHTFEYPQDDGVEDLPQLTQ